MSDTIYSGNTGSTISVATDLVSGDKYQIVKLDVGAAGASSLLSAANGLPVGKIAHLTATPTVTAGAYTTGQVVGGLITLSGATRVNSGSGAIQGVSVSVKTALTAYYDVIFFDTNPSNSTFTDNGSLAVNVADLQSICGVVHCNDLVSLGTPQLLQSMNINIPFVLSAANTNLYAVIVIRGGQTYASTTAIGLNVIIAQT